MHVLSRNCTAAMIRWAAPEERNGKLLGYRLHILYKDEKSTVNITDGHMNTYQITGLCELLLFLCNVFCVYY